MSFGDDLPVWGGNNAIHRELIYHAIEAVGEKPYLVTLRESFEHGYNHADMEPLSVEELREFGRLAQEYANTIRPRRWLDRDGSDLSRQLAELIERRIAQLRLNEAANG